MSENETIVETPEAEQTSDAFLDAWNDDEPTAENESDQTVNVEEEAEEETGNEETNAGATAEETTVVEEKAESETANQQTEQKPITIPVDYMGEHKELTPEQATALAQKGMDYDRIRTKYDEMQPLMNLVNTLAQQSNMTAADYMTALRKQVKMAQGADEASAAREVAVEDREARMAAKEEAENQRRQAAESARRQKAEADARIRADAQQFKKDYPNVKMSDVPQEVWDKVSAGHSLVSAYSQYMVNQMQANVQAKEKAVNQNRKNAERSVGSQKSAGQNKSKDPFLEGW